MKYFVTVDGEDHEVEVVERLVYEVADGGEQDERDGNEDERNPPPTPTGLCPRLDIL